MCSERGLGMSADDWAEIGVEMIELAASVRNTKNSARILLPPSTGRREAACTANPERKFHVERTPTHAKDGAKDVPNTWDSDPNLSQAFSAFCG
jgi:hypothetical protein